MYFVVLQLFIHDASQLVACISGILYNVVFGFIHRRIISNEAKHALITVKHWLPTISVGVRVNCSCFQTELDFCWPGEFGTYRNVIVVFANLIRMSLGQKAAVKRTIQIDEHLRLIGLLFYLSKGLRVSLKASCHQFISWGHSWLAKDLLMDLLFANISYIEWSLWAVSIYQFL